jgi:hypothetical protein
MSNEDAAARSETMRQRARQRWRDHQGDPVLTRAVQTVATYRADLTGPQKATLEAAIAGQEAGSDG